MNPPDDDDNYCDNCAERNAKSWRIEYFTPSSPFIFAPYAPCPSRQLWWSVRKWRPDRELHALFQQVGRDKHGEELKEIWTEDFEVKGVVFRDNIEESFVELAKDPGRIPNLYEPAESSIPSQKRWITETFSFMYGEFEITGERHLRLYV